MFHIYPYRTPGRSKPFWWAVGDNGFGANSESLIHALTLYFREWWPRVQQHRRSR